MDDTDRDSTSPLISPCRCTGTQKFVHLDCLNHWRRSTHNPNALASCQTCGFRYSIVRSNLSIFVCDSRTIYGASALLLLLATLLLGFVVTTLALQQFGTDPSSYIYFVARYDRSAFHPIFQRDEFDYLVVGCFLLGGCFCARNMRSQLAMILEMRDQRQLGLFGIWCASLFQNPTYAARFAIVVGTLIAAKEVIAVVDSEGKQIAQRVGERILEPSAFTRIATHDI